MSDTQQKRKSPVKTIIEKENAHFALAAAELVKRGCEKNHWPVPTSIDMRIEKLTQEIQSDRKKRDETLYIKSGKNWMATFFDSSAAFGHDTKLITSMYQEVKQYRADRAKYRQEAKERFIDSAEQSRYVNDHMRNWTFSDPYMRARSEEEVEKFCPSFHAQYHQQCANMTRAMIRAYEFLSSTIFEVPEAKEYIKAKLKAQAPAQPQQEPQKNVPAPQPQPIPQKRPTQQELEDLQTATRHRWNPEDPSWTNPPKTEAQMEEVLHPRQEEEDEAALSPEQPTKIAHQPKYVQGEFSFMQHIRQ